MISTEWQGILLSKCECQEQAAVVQLYWRFNSNQLLLELIINAQGQSHLGTANKQEEKAFLNVLTSM